MGDAQYEYEQEITPVQKVNLKYNEETNKIKAGIRRAYHKRIESSLRKAAEAEYESDLEEDGKIEREENESEQDFLKKVAARMHRV